MKTLITCLAVLFLSTTQAQFIHEVHIVQSQDDVEQDGNFVNLHDLELDLGWNMLTENKIGLFFREAHINPGTVIDSAVIEFTLRSALTDTLQVTIELESSPFPSRYTDTVSIDEGRSYHSESIEWNIPPADSGSTVVSAQLATLLNTATAASNWGPSAGFNFLISPSGTGNDTAINKAEFYAFDQNNSSIRPRLMVSMDSSNINAIQRVYHQSAITLFPNPSRGLLHIKSQESIDKIQVLDVFGRLVSVHRLNESQTIDISQCPSGIYFLHIEVEGSVEVRRIIKE